MNADRLAHLSIFFFFFFTSVLIPVCHHSRKMLTKVKEKNRRLL